MTHCRKRRYRDKIAAELALATIGHKDNPLRPKAEKRSYRCPACHAWHLTAKR